jgi:predicted site-specific integrase-resolvase
MTAQEPLMVREEVAAAFRVDPKTVTGWGKRRKLACISTPGGHRRYFRAEVEAILAGRPLTAEQVRALREKLTDGAL